MRCRYFSDVAGTLHRTRLAQACGPCCQSAGSPRVSISRGEVMEDRQHGVAYLFDAVVDLGSEGLHCAAQGVAHEAVPLRGPAGPHRGLASGLPDAHKLTALHTLALHIAREVQAL